MLIASLLPLLNRYALGIDLIASPDDDIVTLTIIPRKAEGTNQKLDTGEIRPISITASAAEIDAELGKGPDGALGQLIASRKTLAEQIAEQRDASEAAKASAAEAAKVKATPSPKPAAPVSAPKAASPSSPPADAKPEEPASLW